MVDLVIQLFKAITVEQDVDLVQHTSFDALALVLLQLPEQVGECLLSLVIISNVVELLDLSMDLLCQTLKERFHFENGFLIGRLRLQLLEREMLELFDERFNLLVQMVRQWALTGAATLSALENRGGAFVRAKGNANVRCGVAS